MFALHGHGPRIRIDLVLIVTVTLVLVVAASALSGEPEGAVRLVCWFRDDAPVRPHRERALSHAH